MSGAGANFPPISGGSNGCWGTPAGANKAESNSKAQEVSKLGNEDKNTIKEALKHGADQLNNKNDLNDIKSKIGKAVAIHEIPSDIFDEISKMNNPRAVVDEIRNAKGPDRDAKLISFQNKIDKMSEKDLKNVRDYLVNIMADPNNNDDPTLGAILKTVNKEIDSREPHIIKPNFPHFPIDPMPMPFPKNHPLPIDPGFIKPDFPKLPKNPIDPGFIKPEPQIFDAIPNKKDEYLV